MMNIERFSNVWDALEDTPEEAENMKHRSTLMMALKKHIAATGATQEDAAKIFNVSQPRISNLMRGKINLFTVDTLMKMAATAGLRIELRVLETA